MRVILLILAAYAFTAWNELTLSLKGRMLRFLVRMTSNAMVAPKLD